MRQAGAAKRREQEPDQPPDGASVEADLRRVIAEAAVSAALMRRHDSAAEAVIGQLEGLAAQCPDASRFGLLADGLSAQLVMLKLEGMGLAAHCAEARAACETYAQTASFTEAMRATAFEAGRQAGIAEERARQSRPRAAGSHRRKHLRAVPVIAASGAVAASLVGPVVIAAQDSAAVHRWSPRPVAVRLHAGPADSAVLVPSLPPRAYQPKHAKKPSADAASASPAPPSSPPVFTPAPQPPPPSPSPVQASAVPSGVLNVQTVQVTIGPGGIGQVSFSVVGAALGWTAVSSSPSLTVSTDPLKAGGQEVSGVLGDRQSVVLYVSVAAGSGSGSGWVTVTAGGQSVDVPVTWTSAPGVAV